MSSGEHATYVFCLMQSTSPPVLRKLPDGLPGAARTRALPVDRGLWAIVADVPLERFSGERLHQDLQDIETVSRYALAHAATVEFFFRQAPVIPLKLFTLFSTDARVRSHLVARRRKIAALFRELRGVEEWGVRVSPVRDDAGASHDEARSAPVTTGRAYLERKKRLQAGVVRTGNSKAAGAALNKLGTLAARTRREKFPPPARGQAKTIGSSFLVRIQRRRAWKKLVAALASSLEAQGQHLEVSGPWPPYHFAGGR
jgi:hypothetical protein